jgi:hypothetical protein
MYAGMSGLSRCSVRLSMLLGPAFQCFLLIVQHGQLSRKKKRGRSRSTFSVRDPLFFRDPQFFSDCRLQTWLSERFARRGKASTAPIERVRKRSPSSHSRPAGGSAGGCRRRRPRPTSLPVCLPRHGRLGLQRHSAPRDNTLSPRIPPTPDVDGPQQPAPAQPPRPPSHLHRRGRVRRQQQPARMPHTADPPPHGRPLRRLPFARRPGRRWCS